SRRLSLCLFVPGIFANDHHFAVATNHLAFFTDAFYRRSYLHGLHLLEKKLPAASRDHHGSAIAHFLRYVILPRLKSYGESSTVTLSPGRMRIKCMRILPEM